MADVTGLRQAVSDFVEQAAMQALEQTFRDTLDAAPEHTGALRAKLDTTPVVMISEFVATCSIFCDADYAEWTDGGSVAHEITATKPHGMLVWDGPDGTVFVSGKGGAPAMVFHPGSPGTRWFNGSVEGGEPMASRWESAVAQAVG